MPTPRIKNVGLKRWLDASRDLHNGYGYDRFYRIAMPYPEGLGWTPEAIAAEFGVYEQTIRNWKEYLPGGRYDAQTTDK